MSQWEHFVHRACSLSVNRAVSRRTLLCLTRTCCAPRWQPKPTTGPRGHEWPFGGLCLPSCHSSFRLFLSLTLSVLHLFLLRFLLLLFLIIHVVVEDVCLIVLGWRVGRAGGAAWARGIWLLVFQDHAYSFWNGVCKETPNPRAGCLESHMEWSLIAAWLVACLCAAGISIYYPVWIIIKMCLFTSGFPGVWIKKHKNKKEQRGKKNSLPLIIKTAW